MSEQRRAILFCICGPTASGKSTVCHELIAGDNTLVLSVSTTTRRPRAGEVEGQDYYFIDEKTFREKSKNGEFIEFAEYSGNLYGTQKQHIDPVLASGQDVVFEVEVQGVKQLKKLFGDRLVTIFVFPPSFTELKRRLVERRSETEQQIARRLEVAREEIETLSAAGFADYIVISGERIQCIELAKAIVRAERARRKNIDDKWLRKS